MRNGDRGIDPDFIAKGVASYLSFDGHRNLDAILVVGEGISSGRSRSRMGSEAPTLFSFRVINACVFGVMPKHCESAFCIARF